MLRSVETRRLSSFSLAFPLPKNPNRFCKAWRAFPEELQGLIPAGLVSVGPAVCYPQAFWALLCHPCQMCQHLHPHGQQEWGWSDGCMRWHLSLNVGGTTEGLNEGLKETSCKLWSREAAVYWNMFAWQGLAGPLLLLLLELIRQISTLPAAGACPGGGSVDEPQPGRRPPALCPSGPGCRWLMSWDSPGTR